MVLAAPNILSATRRGIFPANRCNSSERSGNENSGRDVKAGNIHFVNVNGRAVPRVEVLLRQWGVVPFFCDILVQRAGFGTLIIPLGSFQHCRAKNPSEKFGITTRQLRLNCRTQLAICFALGLRRGIFLEIRRLRLTP